jgi:hypothetical protein
MQAVRAGMLIRHELAEIGAIESPGIDHLFAMGIDDGNDLPGRYEGRLAAPCGNFDERIGHGWRLMI